MENKTVEPLVSVVIPYYNDGFYIEETVDSILKQTYKNIEIIIVNDGSTDEFSINKVNDLKKIKTKVIHQENKGLSSARNYGFSKASAQYVLTLDSDDMFEPVFIEKAMQIIQENDTIGAVSAWAKGFGVREFLWELKGGKTENFVYGNQSVSSALIRKDIWQKIEGYREELKNGYEDWDFWLRVTNLGYQIYVIPEPLFLYRQKHSSMLLDTQKKHTQVYAEIVNLNKDIFQKYFLELLVDKERKIYQETQKTAQRDIKINQMLYSREYKIGVFFIKPFKKLVNLFKKKI